MKKPFFYALFLGLGIVAVGASALWLFSESISQPIAFNHRLHIEEVGAECTDCHLYALSGVRATIPNVQVCSSCHEERINDSEDDARLIQHVEAESPIPWKKVYWLPNHVYFSHRRHAALAEIKCQVCHGAMETREKPVTSTYVDLKMNWCIDCHTQNHATNDCIACHR